MAVNIAIEGKTVRPVGEHLRRLRVARGFSLSALARAAGVAQPTLTRWEQGRFAPRLPELEAVLSALSASPEQRNTVMANLQAPRAFARLANETPEDGADWRKATGPRPSGGDLLRAMRRRSGRTLDEVAPGVGISTATLSRWERTETWPDHAQLHTLCYALNAQEAEILALTRGRGTLYTTDSARSETLDSEAVVAQLDALHNDISSPSGLQDLRYFALEATLWPHLGRDATALPLLYLAETSRAGYLLLWNRFAESGAAARRAFEIEAALPATLHRTFVSADPYPQNFGSFFYYNVINYATTLLESSNPVLWRQARRILLEEKAQCERADFQAWMVSTAAVSLELEGQKEAAVTLCLQACDIARACPPTLNIDHTAEIAVEYANRRIDYARLLARTGKYAQALTTLESAVPLLKMGYDSPRHLLLESECLLGLGRRSEAHDLAVRLEAILSLESLPSMQARLAALKARL